MQDRVKAIMADIFRVDAAMINENASMDSIERWDSLAQIDLVAALEEEFDVTFEVEEFEKMTTFPAVLRALDERI